MKSDEGDIHLFTFSQSNLNFVSQLFDTNGTVKSWYLLKQEYHLNNNSCFQWLQLINSIPEKWSLPLNKVAVMQKKI